MARFTYAVLSNAKPGQEAEYEDWYVNQHLDDVIRIPGIVSARLHKLDFQRVYDLDTPAYQLLTLYELECDDPAATIDAIKAQSGTAAMPSCEAATKVGMIQVAGHLIGSRG